MKIEVRLMRTFLNHAKKLSKKHHSLPEDIELLRKELLQNPNMGIPLGNNVSKIRIAIRSKGKGKSGGGRVIAHHEVLVAIDEHTVRLISIYDKSQKDAISDKEIMELLRQNDLG